MTDKEGLLTVPQLAEKLQISEGKIRTLYREKKIPTIRVSYRNVRFDYQDVIQALKASSDPRVQGIRTGQAELNLA